MLADSIHDIVTKYPALLFFMGVLAITVTVLRMRKRAIDARSGKGAAPNRPLRDGGPSAAEFSTMAREMRSLMAELEETARRVAAQVDNRYQKLDALIAEADDKISKLRASSGPAPTHDEPADAETLPPHQVDAAIGPERIYRLADEGRSAHGIAQELGIQPGEVELILKLRR